ncbi:MAG TPA: alkaline phosphatase family protein [Bradyrhizobium sp.]|uniref:alkaline phosphatase family protein n=1 Tax=Bradyrhizobium sp. TaxID=376 RepID=UPI002D801842|nr:alkaline phosphatase family protein [Bradyrhizobium sp.]HET7886330.1 alkaline phosphatase family protein [Bradyrhizobium sp.]
MYQKTYALRSRKVRLLAGVAVATLCTFTTQAGATDPDKAADRTHTATPIKHVIVVLAENSSFDHAFGTFRPRPGQHIANLLSKGIVNENGTPGPNFSKAAQFTVAPQPQYFISAPDVSKTAFATLPPPDLNGVPVAGSDTTPPPFASVAVARAAEPSLEPEDAVLLTTGASGITLKPETTGGQPNGVRNPDTRILNVTNLPNGPFQQTAKDGQGHGLAYDAYTEDTIHRFFQMWQQFDCTLQHASRDNPSGCQADLLPYVITTFAGLAEEGMGTSMAFFNMNQGDAPTLKRLALEYSIADNYHQAVMGGTGANHIMIGTGDVYFFNNTFAENGVFNANSFQPVPPPPVPGAVLGLPPQVTISLVANPDPVPGTNNVYKNDIAASLGEYVNCSDVTQPGVPAIKNYLATLPYKLSPTVCAPSTFYAINNFFPGYHPDGTPANPLSAKQAADGSDFFFIPPQNVPTIGDALNAKNVSWVYYGGGFNEAVAGQPNAYCPICNPMQYAASIYGNSSQIKQHTRDIVDFFADVAKDQLPSVAFVKPSGLVDGHPQSSKLILFEALLDNIVDQVRANPELFAETAIIVTWDESGGFYDSGFIQPVDFFGDGPRVPLLVISPFSRGGRVVHTYYDHVSITKFIERNWGLKPLSARSRDNLPNPVMDKDDDRYVPRNMPAIGDLMEMFDFDDRDDRGLRKEIDGLLDRILDDRKG